MVDELTLDELATNRTRLRAAVESLARTFDSIDSTTQALVDATEASAAGGWVPPRRPTGFARRTGVRPVRLDGATQGGVIVFQELPGETD